MNTYKVTGTFKYCMTPDGKKIWQIRTFEHTVKAENSEDARQKVRNMYEVRGIDAELIHSPATLD